jgi:hypothetical protein
MTLRLSANRSLERGICSYRANPPHRTTAAPRAQAPIRASAVKRHPHVVQCVEAKDVGPAQRRTIGEWLSENLSRDKFNDLVGRIFKHGHMFDDPKVGGTYFTDVKILNWVTDVLSTPDSIYERGTRLSFRKDFGTEVGREQADGTVRTAVLVVIDLAKVTDPNDELDVVDNADFVVAYPVK